MHATEQRLRVHAPGLPEPHRPPELLLSLEPPVHAALPGDQRPPTEGSATEVHRPVADRPVQVPAGLPDDIQGR